MSYRQGYPLCLNLIHSLYYKKKNGELRGSSSSFFDKKGSVKKKLRIPFLLLVKRIKGPLRICNPS